MEHNLRATFDRQMIVCVLSLSLVYAVVLSLFRDINVALDATAFGSQAASVATAALMLATALSGLWRPSLLKTRTLMIAFYTLALSGCLGAVLGTWLDEPLLKLWGLIALTATGSLATLLVKASCVTLGERRILICILASFLLGHLFSFAFSFLGTTAGAILAPAIAFASAAATYPSYRPLLDRLAASVPPGSLAAARPRAFLPLGHPVFIYLFLFNAAHGYLLSFAATGAREASSLPTIVAVIAIAALVARRKGRMFPDALFSASVLLIIGGILLAPLAESGGYLASVLLALGVACFNLLYLYVLLVMSARNEANALPILAWGAFIEEVGITVGGLIGGLVLHQFASDPTVVQTLSVAVVLVILAFVLFTVRSFSFDETIRSLESGTSLDLAAHTAAWEGRCDAIATSAGLTPREKEVFALLARGRNSPYIQKELVITNNTVKAHVRHIYQKLGISSHQELIDLVDQNPPAARPQ